MEITCASCGQAVSIGRLGGAKCPNCGVSIAGVAAVQAVAAAKPAASPGGKADDLLDRLLAEVRQLPSQAPAVPVAAKGDLEPGVFPAPSRAFYEERARGRPATLTVLAIVLVAGAGYLAFSYIRSVIRDQTATDALDRVESDKAFVKNTLQQADEARAAKDYAAALRGYRVGLDHCAPLLTRLQEEAGGLPAGKLKERADAVTAEILSYQKRAQDAVQSPDVTYGSQGMVLLEDGQWATPEQKNKMFVDKMKSEGRTLYQGQWLTDAEIHERNGEAPYEGGWIKRSEYAKIMAASGTTTPPAPPKPAAPKPTATFLDSDAVWVLDNFQKDAFEWTNVPLEWQANPANLSLDKRGDSRRLLVSMLAGNQDKSAIVRPLALDLRSRTTISMDVFNDTGEPMRMAIAVGTGPKDDYYEGRWLTLKAGANNGAQFPLQSSDFKCAPNWTHSVRIGHPEATRWLYVLIYSYGKPGKIYLENISALGGP